MIPIEFLLGIAVSITGHFFIKILKLYSEKLNNSILHQASFREKKSSVELNTLIIGVIIITALILPKQITFSNKIDAYQKNLKSFENKEVKTKIKSSEDLLIYKVKQNISKLYIANILFKSSIYVLLFILVWNFSYSKLINDIIFKFEKDLKKIRPFCDKKEIILLEKEWAEMKTTSNHNAINKKILHLLKEKS